MHNLHDVKRFRQTPDALSKSLGFMGHSQHVMGCIRSSSLKTHLDLYITNLDEEEEEEAEAEIERRENICENTAAHVVSVCLLGHH